VDGIPFSSSTNTVAGAIPGITLNLLGAYPGVQVQLAVAPDATQVEQAISTFVGAYNTIVGDLNTQFAYNPNTNSQGPLAGDSALRTLQSSLLTDGTYATPHSTVYTNGIKDAKTSILANGAQSADLQLQVGITIHDIAIAPGSNDTLNSLVTYINGQNWGVTASVQNLGTGVRLAISTNPGTAGEMAIAANTSILSFNPAVGSAYASLRSMGITMNDDGTLSINASALSSAASSNPSSLLSFFQNAAGTGFANKFAKDLQNLTAPTQGLLNMELSQNQKNQNSITSSIADLQDQISARQRQLETEYSQVNAILESFPYELRAIQMELGITPANSNSGPTSAG
jgi:flagellar hook-associated protein 2